MTALLSALHMFLMLKGLWRTRQHDEYISYNAGGNGGLMVSEGKCYAPEDEKPAWILSICGVGSFAPTADFKPSGLTSA